MGDLSGTYIGRCATEFMAALDRRDFVEAYRSEIDMYDAMAAVAKTTERREQLEDRIWEVEKLLAAAKKDAGRTALAKAGERTDA